MMNRETVSGEPLSKPAGAARLSRQRRSLPGMAAIFLMALIWGAYPPSAQSQTVQQRPVSKAQWEKAAGGLDYSKDVPKPVKPPKPPASKPVPAPDWNWNKQFWGNFAQGLAILLALAGIGYGIYRMMQQPRNRVIAHDGTEITVDNVEAYLHETDLGHFLREALAQQNYPLAIRLYFLQVIKRLSETGAIHWSKEKTNRDYLRAMQHHRLQASFLQVTHTYERIWYGNMPLAAPEFARLEPEYVQLLREIDA